MPNIAKQLSLAAFLGETLAGASVRNLFGVPGGDSSLDVIAADAPGTSGFQVFDQGGPYAPLVRLTRLEARSAEVAPVAMLGLLLE